VQLTPDLLPGDVLGVSVYNRDKNEFEFKPGPIFTNVLLADEINRTTPRTQSALLEAMSEEQVSVENHTFALKRPFMVVATQNPFEFEGTYHLPENQLDRFILRVAVGYPTRASEQKILTTQPGRTLLDNLKPVMSADEVVELQDRVPNVRTDPAIVDYILDLVESTRKHEQLHLGLSTRGALALTAATQAAAIVKGRDYVLPDDVKDLFIACCAHRVISKTYLGNGDTDATGRILQSILERVPAPK
jgi:MoxR-like ATPase